MHDEKYVFLVYFLMNFDIFDDLVMNGVFPLEDFNRYVAVSVLECL